MPDYYRLRLEEGRKANPGVKGVNNLTKSLENLAGSTKTTSPIKCRPQGRHRKAKDLKAKAPKGNGLGDYLKNLLDKAQDAAKSIRKRRSTPRSSRFGKRRGQLRVNQESDRRSQTRPENSREFVFSASRAAWPSPRIRSPRTKEHAKSWRKGKGKLLLGFCYGEGGKFVFEFETDPRRSGQDDQGGDQEPDQERHEAEGSRRRRQHRRRRRRR